VSTKRLGSGYHDASRFFLGGHGKAARQGLETCVGCHVERDCLACHSAAGGRRFSPHGPGFDGSRLKRKNPEVCTACHGTAIPGG
jgi:predicted CXXCH cytochrome family protein